MPKSLFNLTPACLVYLGVVTGTYHVCSAQVCTIDLKINFSDVLQALAAFTGGTYPFEPDD